MIVMAVIWLTAMAMRSAAAGGPQSPAPVEAGLPAGEGSEVARSRCLICHRADLIAQQRLTRDGWDRELAKMIGWGAGVTEPERPALLEYLATYFGVTRPRAAPGPAGAELLTTRCHVCHDAALIDQQRLTLDGWRREIDKMRTWGAQLTDAEQAALAEYLAAR